MTEADLKRWAKLLRDAADVLEWTEPNGFAYTAARLQVNRVADQMYRAHDQAAEDAWDRIREVARRERGAA